MLPEAPPPSTDPSTGVVAPPNVHVPPALQEHVLPEQAQSPVQDPDVSAEPSEPQPGTLARSKVRANGRRSALRGIGAPYHTGAAAPPESRR